MKTEAFIDLLTRQGQDHLVGHIKGLAPDKQEEFVRHNAGLDVDLSLRLFREFRANPGRQSFGRISPAAVISLPRTAREEQRRERARAIGESLIRANRVACLIVAGGQGSRLDHPGPKGTFPVTPVKAKPLFHHFAESLLALSRRYKASIPLLIMTSAENHEDTVNFFASHGYFGLPDGSVRFFSQDLLPSVTTEGKLVLKDEGHIFANPDGHGGSLKALHRSGLLRLLLDGGFTHLSYCQVDNPLVKLVDPVFLGYHEETGAECSTKVVRRRDVNEKVGVYVSVDGRDAVVEYSDLGPEYMAALDERGEILYWAGNTAIHIFSLPFIDRLTEGPFALPFHCAVKTVEHLDGLGKQTRSQCWKFETFVFDAIPLARKTGCMEILREEEFSPVKNREGEDSPATARRAMSDLYRGWLRDTGITIPEENMVEISPLFAMDRGELRRKVRGGKVSLKGNVYFG